MPTALVPLVDGFEETEAITTIDILRRAGVEVTTAGVGKRSATGSHDITVETDAVWRDVAGHDYDAIVLPGGPGVPRLNQTEGLHERLRRQAEEGRLVAAICAAPSILADAGLLRGKRAACFPSVEDKLRDGGAQVVQDVVVEDGTLLTSRGVGTALDFACAVAARLAGRETAEDVARKALYQRETVY